MWIFSIITISWMMKHLKGKTEVGSCHSHREEHTNLVVLAVNFITNSIGIIS
jgi:hypothetical protein